VVEYLGSVVVVVVVAVVAREAGEAARIDTSVRGAAGQVWWCGQRVVSWMQMAKVRKAWDAKVWRRASAEWKLRKVEGWRLMLLSRAIGLHRYLQGYNHLPTAVTCPKHILHIESNTLHVE
jgi:hypothetical protein